jgi:polyisoprenoid-binding protein YceI
MRMRFLGSIAALILILTGVAPIRADDYAVDPVHSSVYFKISHMNLSDVFGRFNEFSGNFTIDSSDAGKSSFTLSIKPESIDTNNKGRDKHLCSPDFLNVKQYSTLEFKSTAVKAVDGGYEVTGDVTMHGETKPVTFTLKGGNKAEFPKGKERTGFTTEFTLKRSDFGINKFQGMLGEEVKVAVGLEAVKK